MSTMFFKTCILMISASWTTVNAFQCAKVTNKCPEGWIQNKNECYRLEQSKGCIDYDDANALCKEKGGYMARMRDEAEKDAVDAAINVNKMLPYIWVGARDINYDPSKPVRPETDYRWEADNTKVGPYTQWRHGEPNQAIVHGVPNIYESCIMAYHEHGKLVWNDLQCNRSQLIKCGTQNDFETLDMKSVVCAKEATTIITYKCPEGWIQNKNECYRLEQSKGCIDYDDANALCKEKGGYMARMRDEAEKDAVDAAIKVNKMLPYIWLGARDINYDPSKPVRPETDYRWEADNTKVGPYTQWRHGEPNQAIVHGVPNIYESCIMAYHEHGELVWNDLQCNRSQLVKCGTLKDAETLDIKSVVCAKKAMACGN